MTTKQEGEIEACELVGRCHIAPEAAHITMAGKLTFHLTARELADIIALARQVAPPIAAPSQSAEQPASGTFCPQCGGLGYMLEVNHSEGTERRVPCSKCASGTSDAAWQEKLDALREERDAIQDRYDLLTTEIAQGPDLIGRMRRERDAAKADAASERRWANQFAKRIGELESANAELEHSIQQQESAWKARAEAAEARCRELEGVLREIRHGAVTQGAHTGMSWGQVQDMIDALLGK